MGALHVDEGLNNIPTTDADRCLGCGVCVSECSAGAMHLVKKDKETVPPADHMELIMKIGIGKGQARNPN